MPCPYVIVAHRAVEGTGRLSARRRGRRAAARSGAQIARVRRSSARWGGRPPGRPLRLAPRYWRCTRWSNHRAAWSGSERDPDESRSSRPRAAAGWWQSKQAPPAEKTARIAASARAPCRPGRANGSRPDLHDVAGRGGGVELGRRAARRRVERADVRRSPARASRAQSRIVPPSRSKARLWHMPQSSSMSGGWKRTPSGVGTWQSAHWSCWPKP